MVNAIQQTMAKVVNALDLFRIDYCLIGGLAVGMRGSSRSTFDVDFLLDIPQVTLARFLEHLVAIGFEIDVFGAIQTWQRNGLLALNDSNGVQVDLLKSAIPAFTAVLRRATEIGVDDQTIRVASTEGLILLKLIAFRPQDELDLKTLVATSQKFDREWLKEQWAPLAGMAPDRWAAFELLANQF